MLNTLGTEDLNKLEFIKLCKLEYLHKKNLLSQEKILKISKKWKCDIPVVNITLKFYTIYQVFKKVILL